MKVRASTPFYDANRETYTVLRKEGVVKGNNVTLSVFPLSQSDLPWATYPCGTYIFIHLLFHLYTHSIDSY